MNQPDLRESLILENIYYGKHKISQRKIAHTAGISLGMANAILKKLLTKGWITIKKINKRTMLYAVTPAGVKAIVRRSFGYLRRTIENISVYKQKIEIIIDKIKYDGFKKIVLIGKSNVDFIIEYFCLKKGVLFFYHRNDNIVNEEENCFYLVSENISEKTIKKDKRVDAHLMKLLIE
jgi:predicted transcriptional regulator